MQLFAQVVSLAITAVALVFTVRAVAAIIRVIRIGQPATRTDQPAARALTVLKETVLHTRMLQWHWIGILHWFIFAAFLVLSGAVMTGYFQLFDPEFALPIIGHWYPYEWISEFLGLLGTLAIIVLIVYRQVKNPSRLGRQSRFFGSTKWQAYFVEAMVLLESVAILFIRGAEYKLFGDGEKAHFPVSWMFGEALYPDNPQALKNIIFFVAMVKIVSAMAWLLVISTNLTMGVAWHRFTAWFNIFFKREASGRTALGAMKPMTSQGEVVNFEDLEDMDEDTKLGVGAIEDFSWKGILDFSTCTECGRCQSQCPAWNTDKPLSPKLLVMGLRDHAYAKAPYLNAESEEARADLPAGTLATAERELIGKADDGQWLYNPDDGDFVIDSDVLWSCTSCGACVQQCPVDIEHVDHIMDMRRYQILVESNFPAELNGLFKGLENKGNPWNMNPKGRMEWAQGLDFEVPVLGEGEKTMDDFEWLFWVGCAGAYEDRAKKTTRAVAELLTMAGVEFAVLGNGETCTGDPARRAGNEFVFQGLATQNAETLKEHKVKKVVSTCAHCFNTLKNEYAEFGVELEVVHHTQLLNRLVREKKLTPVASQGAKRSITYHDPCYLGRHNQVYSPPRELLQVIPDAELTEMPRNSEKSFCCGAGGARMWMEENLGERINLNRTQEAVATGADQIAVGCPFCRVMLSDGLTAQQSKGEAREEVEVLDVAQLLLASVKGETSQPKAQKSAGKATAAKAAAGTATAGTAAAAGAASSDGQDSATKAEPEAGDATQTENTVTETEDVGAGAQASGGSSLFDDSSSLFDTPQQAAASEQTTQSQQGEPQDDTPVSKAAETPAPAQSTETGELGGGSLFDLGASESAPTQSSEASESSEAAAPAEADAAPQALAPQASAPTEAKSPAADTGSDSASTSGSASGPTSGPTSGSTSGSTAAEPATEIGSGSLFDLEAPAQPETPTTSQPATDATDGASGADASGTDTTTEDPAGDSTTDANLDRTQDAADTSTPTDATPEPDTAPAPAAAAPAPATEIGSGSLFDIEAPAQPETSATTTSKPSQPTDAGDTGQTAGTDTADTADRADDDGAIDSPDSGADTTTEDPAGDSTTDANLDRTQNAADPDSVPEPASAAEAGDDQPSTEQDTPLRTLRDIKAAHAGDSGSSADAAPQQASSEAESASSSRPESAAGSDSRPESEPATAATAEEAGEDSDGESDGDSGGDPSEEAHKATSDEAGAPASTPTRSAQTPATDKDIAGADSLFDL